MSDNQPPHKMEDGNDDAAQSWNMNEQMVLHTS